MKEPTQSVIQSVENRIEEFDTHPEIIENFDLLKRTGVLDDILDYVVSKLLEKFVPSYFALVLQEPTRAKFLTVRCYRNMRPCEQCLHINTYGHLLGDEVLVRISEILTSMTRREDVVSRFGGEEFSILMTNLSKHAAWNIAERIRVLTEETVIGHKGKELSLTISIGIRHISLYSYAPAQTLIEEADSALYLSKSRGRNRTSVHNR